MVTINYYFGRYDDELFPYEVDIDEYTDSLSLQDKLNLAKSMYDDLPKTEKEYAKNEYNISSEDDFIVGNTDSYDYINDVLFTIDFEDLIFQIEEDRVEDFFRSEAYEAYEDSKLDPYISPDIVYSQNFIYNN